MGECSLSGVCPGFDLETSIPCSGHGHCDNFICECTEEYYGTGCELKKTPGKLESNPPNSLSFTVFTSSPPLLYTLQVKVSYFESIGDKLGTSMSIRRLWLENPNTEVIVGVVGVLGVALRKRNST